MPMRLPMRLITTAMVLLALPGAAQAITPQRASDDVRLRGIAERTPGTTRLPGSVEVHVGTSDAMVAHDLREARRSIERRRDNGELSRREARQLRREARLITRLSYRYGHDGLSASERRELTLRANVLRAQAAAPPLASRQR
jgi:hypothetical protein